VRNPSPKAKESHIPTKTQGERKGEKDLWHQWEGTDFAENIVIE